MAPNVKDGVSIGQEPPEERLEKLVAPQAAPRKFEIVYFNLLTFGYGHLAAIYGFYLCFTSAKWGTIVLNFFLLIASEIGITAGAHRLWTHKTYKAKWPLQVILMVFNSIAFQNTATDWIRDHRLHHKYSDTDADPHNATRGFFYSHVGWLLVKKHHEVKKRGKTIDMSDIHNNPVLRFQKKYAVPFIGSVCFLLPTLIPMYFWGETLSCAWHVTLLRYVLNLNITFLVNSAAHLWGNKPYDKHILPAQNLTVSLLALGEGFHNYHHAFPWDYRTAELGNNSLNLTTRFIDFFAWIGWAYDLRSVSEDVIKARSTRTGDGTNLWGWGDKDMSEEDKQLTHAFVFIKVRLITLIVTLVAPCLVDLYQFRDWKNLYHHQLPKKSTGEKDNIEEHKDNITTQYPKSGVVKLAIYPNIEVKLGEVPHNVFICLHYKQSNFRAICAGSIIGENRILSAAHCFLTNRLKLRHPLKSLKIVAGSLNTYMKVNDPEITSAQWRNVVRIYSQDYFRYPAYNLAVLVLDANWEFNKNVAKIAFASQNQDYDGVCEVVGVRPVTETEGAGLVCHGTGDPAETDPNVGILIGVTSLVNSKLPTLHNRVGSFKKWIEDHCSSILPQKLLLFVCIIAIVVGRCIT